jgi:hypothetical protein
MIDPQLTAATIALGGSTDAYSMPYSANARAPGQVFVTVHGSTVDAVDAASGAPLVFVGIGGRGRFGAPPGPRVRAVLALRSARKYAGTGRRRGGSVDLVNNRYNFPARRLPPRDPAAPTPTIRTRRLSSTWPSATPTAHQFRDR